MLLGYCSPRVSIDPLFLFVFALSKHLLTALRSLSAKNASDFWGAISKDGPGIVSSIVCFFFIHSISPSIWRKPHESNMGAASAPLHRFHRFFAFVSPGIAPALYISHVYTHYPDSWAGLGAGELTVCRSISGCQQAVSLSCALSLWAMHRRLFRCVSKVYRLAFRPAFTDGCDPASLSLLAF